MAILPIWKPYEVDLTGRLSGGKVTYTVYADGVLIYTGTAYADAHGRCVVRLNDVIADRLTHTDLQIILSAVDDSWEAGAGAVSVTVKVGNTSVAEDVILAVWDYETEEFEDVVDLSRPISEEVVAGARYPYSRIDVNETGAAFYNMRTEVLSGGVDCCNPAILYYLNSAGGWDWLLCKCGAHLNESYNKASVRPSDTQAQTIWRNTVQRRWECFSGRINGHPERIGELLGTVDCVLWTPDLGYVPVTVDAGEAAGKTYRRNGNRPVEYTITVSERTERTRR